MRKLLCIAVLLAASFTGFTQVGINTSTPHPSTALDIESTTLGFLPPRMNTAERDLINGNAPAEGLTIYNTDYKGLNIFNGITWVTPCFSASTVIASDCALNGFEGVFLNSIALTAADKFSVMVTNTSGTTQTIPYSAWDLVISGSASNGIAVNSVTATPAGALAAGASQSVEYTLSGTPVTGDLTATWTTSGLSCSVTRPVSETSVNFTLPLPQTATILSVLDVVNTNTTDIQGSINNTAGSGGKQFIVNMPYTDGTGSYDAYTSAIVPFTAGTGQTASDTNGFHISYPAGDFTSSPSGTLAVTIVVDGDGDFDAKKLSFGELKLIAAMDFQFNGNSLGLVNLQSVGFPIVTINDGPNPGDTITFMAHNLGSDYSSDPDQPSVSNNGNYYQYGRKAPVADAFFHGAISGYPGQAPTSWSGATKTADDPCLSGFRVPTRSEWNNVIAHSPRNYANDSGTFISGDENYGTAMVFTGATESMTLTATGYRKYANGELSGRGSYGAYWSSTEDIATEARYIDFNHDSVNDPDSFRTYGFSVRCVSE